MEFLDGEKVIQANKHFYDEISSFHDRTNSYIARKSCRKFYENLMCKTLKREHVDMNNDRVLELGCGSGNWYPFFASYNIQEYVGVDISERMIAQARKRYTAFGGIKTNFITENAEDFVHRSKKMHKTFDLIISFSFLHHLVEPRQFLNELVDILSPNGIYIAFHEVNQRSPFSLSHRIDFICSYLSGYDTADRPFILRMKRLFSKVLEKSGLKTNIGRNIKFDWVEYQLNSQKFSPAFFSKFSQKYVIRTFSYGYYVYQVVKLLFGNDDNYFYLVLKHS